MGVEEKIKDKPKALPDPWYPLKFRKVLIPLSSYLLYIYIHTYIICFRIKATS